jgi:hypothetical protein
MALSASISSFLRDFMDMLTSPRASSSANSCSFLSLFRSEGSPWADALCSKSDELRFSAGDALTLIVAIAVSGDLRFCLLLLPAAGTAAATVGSSLAGADAVDVDDEVEEEDDDGADGATAIAVLPFRWSRGFCLTRERTCSNSFDSQEECSSYRLVSFAILSSL